MNKSKIFVHCFLVLIIFSMLITGCNPRAEDRPAVPPQIPPISSFVMDFAEFSSRGNTSLLPGNQMMVTLPASFMQGGSGIFPPEQYAIGARQNWGFAVLNVGFWSVIIIIGMAIPVTAFVESFNHTPEQQNDYTWVWSYDVTVDGVVHTAELHGKYIDNGVRWDMYISKQNEYTDFHWYYGESALPATEGFWVLKKNPSDATDLLRIDWGRDIADSTYDIKYTNIIPNGPENGGYISHGVKAGGEYDRFYEIYNKGKDEYTYIEWNNTTKEGRVKDARHFDDNEWHCWGAEYLDIECQ